MAPVLYSHIPAKLDVWFIKTTVSGLSVFFQLAEKTWIFMIYIFFKTFFFNLPHLACAVRQQKWGHFGKMFVKKINKNKTALLFIETPHSIIISLNYFFSIFCTSVSGHNNIVRALRGRNCNSVTSKGIIL